MSLGPSEIFLVLIAVLLLFGGKRLPDVARSIGRGLAEVRRMTLDVKRELTVDPTEPPPRKPTDRQESSTPEPPEVKTDPAAQPRSSEGQSGSDS